MGTTAETGLVHAAPGTSWRYAVDRVAGASGRPPGGEIIDAGPWPECFTWEEPGSWLGEGLP